MDEISSIEDNLIVSDRHLFNGDLVSEIFAPSLMGTISILCKIVQFWPQRTKKLMRSTAKRYY